MVDTTARPRTFLRLRGKSFMSVVLTPELPEDEWLGQLDEQIARSPKVFDGRPVLLDVSLLAGRESAIAGLVAALNRRGVRVIGIDGTAPHALGALAAELPPVMAGGRNAALLGENEPGYMPAAARQAPAPAPEPPRAAESSSLVVDHPVRSGQSVTHTAGDVTVVGSVASGAEVIAGGSIHVYGTLRGRAIAGLLGSAAAGGAAGGGSRPRIFCRRLEAELVAIDGVYRTADEIAPALFGRAVQAWLEGDELRVAALD